MKDAKGHGSDPKGAHAQGVDQIGKPLTRPLSQLRPTQDAQTNAPIGGQNMTTDTGRTYNLNLLRGDIPLSKADNQSIIDSYRTKIRAGESIMPILITEKGNIIDGNHRHAAYKAESVKDVPVEIQKNTRIGR